jgi:hypothetical protein
MRPVSITYLAGVVALALAIGVVTNVLVEFGVIQ